MCGVTIAGTCISTPNPIAPRCRPATQSTILSTKGKTTLDFSISCCWGWGMSKWSGVYRACVVVRLRLLDVGCATGALLEYYHKRGWRVQGVEICQEAAEWGRAARGVPIYSGALHDARCAADSFDLVHASHLIEHLSDPGAFLKECRRVVAPEGYVVIVTPDRGGLQARLLGADWRSAIADHLHLFDFQRLKRLALQSGLRVVAKRSWGGLAQDVAPPWLRWLKRVADWAAKRLNIGDVMIVVLRREQ